MNVSRLWNNLTITQTEMGRILGVTQQRVGQLIKEGVMVTNDSNKILLVQSLQSFYKKDLAEEKEKHVSYDEEKALHERAKREIAELKLGELKNDLHKTEDIVFLVGGMVTIFRRHLLALPSKLAVSLAGKSPEDINEELTKHINGALTELSTFDASKLVNIYDEDDTEEDN